VSHAYGEEFRIHACVRNRLASGGDTHSGKGAESMTCYRISQGDEAIAILTSLGMAQAITRCQPPGYYRVDEIDVNSPIVERQPPAWR